MAALRGRRSTTVTNFIVAHLAAAILASGSNAVWTDAAAHRVEMPPLRHHVPFPHRVERASPACGGYDPQTDTYVFCVSPLRGGGSYAVKAKKLAETKDAFLFAQIDANGAPIRVAGGPDRFLAGFQTVYDLETAKFGAATDVDHDGRIWVLVCDLGDTPGAYYDPSYTNRSDMLVFDYRIDDAAQYGSHELMHDILGNYDIAEEMWVYEGTAMYGTQFWSGNGPYDDGNHIEYITWAHTVNIPLNWAMYDQDLLTAMVQYEIAYLFMLYLSDRFGGPEFIGDLMRDGPSFDPAQGTHVQGIAGVEAALARAGSPRNFAQVFDDWVAANYLNQCPEGDQTLCYTTMRQHVPSSYRHTQYPASGYGPIAPWAGQYVEFYAPGYQHGVLTVSWNGDSGVRFTVRAAAHDSARVKPPVVVELVPDADNNATFTYDSFGRDYDTVSLIVAAHPPGQNIYFRWNADYTRVYDPDAGVQDAHWYFDAGYDAGEDAGPEPTVVDAPGCGCAMISI